MAEGKKLWNSLKNIEIEFRTEAGKNYRKRKFLIIKTLKL
jgi:hypothetical protein